MELRKTISKSSVSILLEEISNPLLKNFPPQHFSFSGILIVRALDFGIQEAVMDEAKAIAQLKAGDIAGLQMLVEMYQVDAIQAACLITGDRAIAEDIVQAAFLRAFDKIQGFDGTRPFRPWFLRMVVNDAIKASIQQSRKITLKDDGDEAYEVVLQKLAENTREPEDAVEQEDLVTEMRQAIAQLSPSQRAAVVMHYFLNLSTAESASQLNCAPGTLRWHLSVARERLRTLLASFK
jgi:RNA polymerase sigma-70 factor (ECF subfamily)